MSETTSTPPEQPEDVVDRALGSLDHLLDVLHDRVLRPIFLVGRSVAFGFILAVVGIVIVTVVLVALFRILNVYAFPGDVWASYMLVGVLLVAGGTFIWRKRKPVPLRK